MDALRRDEAMGERVIALARARPFCAGLRYETPTRLIVTHAMSGGHVKCRAWIRSAAALCREAGCPNIEAMLFQVTEALEGLPPGVLRYWGGRARHGQAGPRRARGQIDSPARLLLARRWHRRLGATWEGVAEKLGDEVAGWIEVGWPEWADESYPAWREWAELWQSRDIGQLPPSERAAIALKIAEGEPDGVGRLSAASTAFAGETLRKGVAKIERILAANLPAA
jgi:hypothetical protein